MYGSEYGTVLGKDTCNRCDSETSLRGLQRKNTKIIVINAVCPKCHYVEIRGFTSTESIAYEQVRTKLLRMRDFATHPSTIRRLDRKLAILEHRKKFNDLSL